MPINFEQFSKDPVKGLLFISNNIIAHRDLDDNSDNVDTPIDGGASLLIGSGLVFGLKKLKNRKKSKE